MAKKIVFVGRECHFRSGCDLFLIDLLREVGDVTVLRRGTMPKRELALTMRSHSPDLVVFFQNQPHWNDIARPFFGTRKVWVPMLDGFRPLRLKRRLGHRLFDVQAISFAQPLHDHFVGCGLPSLSMCYFPKPDLKYASTAKAPPYTIFLCQRDPRMGLELIADIFEPNQVKKVIYKCEIWEVTTGSYPFEVERLERWLLPDVLTRKIGEADYYIAPKTCERAGLGFLEAMALGKVVIGHDQGLMRECITDGVNGHLLRNGRKLSVHWPSPAEMQANIAHYCEEAHANWLEDRQRLKAFLSEVAS